MADKLVVIAEASLNFLERYTPIVKLVRQYNNSIQLIGIFVKFIDFKPIVFDEKYFDELYFPFEYKEASVVIARFADYKKIFLVNHIPSLGDSVIYRLAKDCHDVNKKLVFRNCVSLKRFFDTGFDDSVSLTKRVEKVKSEENEIRFKVSILSLLVSVLVFSAQFWSKMFATRTVQRKRILFIKLDVLGDMIVALPYLKALREAYSDADITIMASSHGAGILKDQSELYARGLFDHLLIWDAPWHFPSKSVLGVSELRAIFKWLPKLWRERFDIVIQPVVFGTGLAFALLALGKRTFAAVDSGLPLARALRPLVSDPVDIDKKRIYHMKDYAEQTLRALNIERSHDNLPDLTINKRASVTVDTFLNANGYNSDLLIAVNVGARNPVRIWSVNKIAEVIHECKKRFKATIVLLGSEKERVLAEDISACSKVSVINSAGKLSFNELIALVARSNLVVTADTGIMHLAAAVKAPIVAIYGAGLVDSCHPLNDDFVIVKKELGCSGCADRCFTPPPAPCMEALTPNDVLTAITQLLIKQKSVKSLLGPSC